MIPGELIEHVFACAAFDAVAATVRLAADGAPLPRRDGPDVFGDQGWRIDVDIAGGGAMRWPLEQDVAGRVVIALEAEDFEALRVIDRDPTRFACRNARRRTASSAS